MRLYEHEAKNIFMQNGIPIPVGSVATTPSQVRKIAENLDRPVVLKSQIPTGRRGKSGGIRFAKTPDVAEEMSTALLGSKLYGYRVNSLLVEEMFDVRHEYYVGVTFDASTGKPVVVVSSMGGMDIEELAKKFHDKVHTCYINILLGLQPFESRFLTKKLSLQGDTLNQASTLLKNLYHVFERYGCLTSEINPLALDASGHLVALDARLEVDDAAGTSSQITQRPDDSIVDELEKKARERGLNYVRLEGDIGVFCVGAGLAMLTMDLLSLHGGKPANFLDTGGAPSTSLVREAFGIILESGNLKGLLINVYGGLTDLKEMALATVDILAERKLKIPVVAKMHGPNQDEAWRILESYGVEVSRSIKTEEATKRIIDLVDQHDHTC